MTLHNEKYNTPENIQPYQNELKTDTEVAALLSADLKDEKYYDDVLKMNQQSPRYKGWVEANMEYSRNPIVGPIGLPSCKDNFRKQTLVAGIPVKPENEMKNRKSELLYSGDVSVVQRPKEPNHANLARQRVQQKTSKELLKLEKEHRDMNTYLSKYQKERAYKDQVNLVEKKRDMNLLQTYNPFGKPGGGAPLKTNSGSNIPGLSRDFELRFRDDDYHKKMVEVGKRYKTPTESTQDYKKVLDHQLNEKQHINQQNKQKDLSEEKAALKYDPFGKPGGGAPRSTDLNRHWSTLEPQLSYSTMNDKRNRLKLQAQDNLERSYNFQTNKKVQNDKMQRNDEYNPWGKGCGNPTYDKQGNTNVRFGMKTQYDIFNKIPIITTHSGHTIGGWPLETAGSKNPHSTVVDLIKSGRGCNSNIESNLKEQIHSAYSGPPSNQRKLRSGLLSRRHEENFVSEPKEQQPSLLNGRETTLTNKSDDSRKPKSGKLVKIGNESYVYPLLKTEHDQSVSKPSAGTLKRELDQANNDLNLKVNDNYSKSSKATSKESINSGPMDDSKNSIPLCSSNLSSVKNIKDLNNVNRYNRKSNYSNQDVADWMRSSKVSQPRRDPISGIIKPTKRCTSDVTRHRLDIRAPTNPTDYYNDLAAQVKERALIKKMERERELNSEKNWDTSLFKNFGRPGGGAPSERGAARRQFSNPSLMPQNQLGTNIPHTPEGLSHINSSIGGYGHGAIHEKGTRRRMFSNAALVPSQQDGTNIPRIIGDKPTSVKSLMHMDN